ncbi:hypothetical protein Rumeso_03744 [Rubellimicrobium mesophilum DSM 19309]|uniref:Ferrochelatase n=1 Tax=Rubellimicrobium mesophilum DSM 19309 TaxID=442562 RepID=A0A017HJL3_9RHOB|nr:hypothetical protein [Rubellimicrobium mesophilum]EYD74687.1 hypothetical protein Rumeso_03744 [Rubellimicrobium mesophilum DSM 19309]
MRLTKLALAAVLGATLASQAVAGGFAPVVVEPAPAPVVVTEPEAPRSTFGILLPLALLGGLVALAVANEDEDSES